jgi:acetyl esterase
MALDPAVQTLLDTLAAAGQPPMEQLTPVEARAAFAPFADFAGPPEPVAGTRDAVAPGPAGDIPVRVYTPSGPGPFPVLVYYHGGGWVLGNLDSHDALCRLLTNRSGAVVVAADYRLAPEHKFPAAVDDAYAVLEWVAKEAGALRVDPARIAVGGDSAGGNLAAVVAQLARDRRGPAIVTQVLIYPVTNYAFDTASYTQNADGYLLTRTSMEWFWDHYLPTPADGARLTASPLRAADLAGLPPALVITAEYDPLRDEGEGYGRALQQAGVATTITRYDGMIHGFFQLPVVIPRGWDAIDEVARHLKQAFAVNRSL